MQREDVAEAPPPRVSANHEHVVPHGGHGVRVPASRLLRAADLLREHGPRALLRVDAVHRGVRARRHSLRAAEALGGFALALARGGEIGLGTRRGDRLRGRLQRLRDARRVATVREQREPVRVLLLHSAHVHAHRVERGDVAELRPAAPFGALDGVPAPRLGRAARARGRLLVQRVQQKPGLIGDRARAQGGVRSEAHRRVEAVGERDPGRHRFRGTPALGTRQDEKMNRWRFPKGVTRGSARRSGAPPTTDDRPPVERDAGEAVGDCLDVRRHRGARRSGASADVRTGTTTVDGAQVEIRPPRKISGEW